CPQGQRVFSGNPRHTFRAHHPDRVSGQQIFVFVHFGWKPISKIAHALEKSNRWLERQATNADVRGHHALAAHHLEPAKDVLAMPAWREPMSSIIRPAVSRSISRIYGATPGVDGCCGPMLRIVVRSSTGSSTGMGVRWAIASDSLPRDNPCAVGTPPNPPA